MGDFSISVNVTGLAPVTPFVYLPTNAYKVKLVDGAEKANKNASKPANAVITVAIDEPGAFAGVMKDLTLGRDMNEPTDFIRRLWRTFLLSVGVPLAQLDTNAPVNASFVQHFRGKTAYIHVQAPPPGEKDAQGEPMYADLKFITPEMYAQQRRPDAPAGAVATSTVQAPAAAPGGFTGAMGTPQPGVNGSGPIAAALSF